MTPKYVHIAIEDRWAMEDELPPLEFFEEVPLEDRIEYLLDTREEDD